MEKQFEYIQKLMKEQLRCDQFDEFGLPATDCQRLIGRVINVNPDDNSKLCDSNIGLLNLSDENTGGVYKLKLQLGDLQSYSFFDGEVVVVDGIFDQNNSKINVIRIHKPMVLPPPSNITIDEMKNLTVNNYRERPIQVMIACGPFTFKNSLSYQGLLDFCTIVRKERPHTVIFMGPFLDINQNDIYSGELFYETPDNQKIFITHEELFQDLLSTINKEL